MPNTRTLDTVADIIRPASPSSSVGSTPSVHSGSDTSVWSGDSAVQDVEPMETWKAMQDNPCLSQMVMVLTEIKAQSTSYEREVRELW